MLDTNLTRDADALICLLYKHYCLKKKDGMSKAQAKMFGSSVDIQQNIIPNMSHADVDETCKELGRAGLLDNLYADDIAYVVILSDSAVVYMENRFKNGLDSVLDYLSKIKGLIPFI
ncbi:hypothetical protein EDM59_01720 [Brevibacillus nitrificans]|uniref:Uncharacterized protein n=1 Tax=Brevibacillus nitrificans TaxID=651560 RepID=A0A3M8DQ00_9BACL|nr:hypothetical protein EDM59_01720 [Brevibacillus nitrificans]